MVKKAKQAQETLQELLDRPWCYYCGKDFDHQGILQDHQKARHFKCIVRNCNRRLNTAGGLHVHMQQVHKEDLTEVPNAIEGRKDPTVEIFNMLGVPEDLLRQRRQAVEEAYYRSQAEHRARTGNPLPGTEQEPAAKKQKTESKEELRARLAQRRAEIAAKKAAEADGGDGSGNSTPNTATPNVVSALPASPIGTGWPSGHFTEGAQNGHANAYSPHPDHGAPAYGPSAQGPSGYAPPSFAPSNYGPRSYGPPSQGPSGFPGQYPGALNSFNGASPLMYAEQGSPVGFRGSPNNSHLPFPLPSATGGAGFPGMPPSLPGRPGLPPHHPPASALSAYPAGNLPPRPTFASNRSKPATLGTNTEGAQNHGVQQQTANAEEVAENTASNGLEELMDMAQAKAAAEYATQTRPATQPPTDAKASARKESPASETKAETKSGLKQKKKAHEKLSLVAKDGIGWEEKCAAKKGLGKPTNPSEFHLGASTAAVTGAVEDGAKTWDGV